MRRRQRRLQAVATARTPERRNGPCRDEPSRSPTGTDEGKGRERGARCSALHGCVPEDALSQTAGAQFFSLGDDDVEAPAAVRPAPLVEVRPQMGYKRHCGSGFELVLDVTLPQLGRELVEVPNVMSPVVEQNVHIPVRGGGRSKIPRGGVQGLRPGQGPTFQFFSPAPAVSQSPAPVVEYISHTPAVSLSPTPVVEYISPAPAVSQPPAPVEELHHTPAVFPATAPVIEYISPAPAVFPATAPVTEVISPAPAVFPATAPVVEYFSPAPAVFPVTAPVVEYFPPAPAVSHATAPVVEYFLTRASRASSVFISGCWWRLSRLCPRTEFSCSRWSCCPWSTSSGPYAISGGRALRAGRAPS